MTGVAYRISLVAVASLTTTNLRLPGGLGSLSRGVAFFLILSWLLSARRMPRFHTFHLVFVAYLSWDVMSMIWTCDIDSTLETLQHPVQGFILTVILYDLWQDRSKLRAGMQAYIVGTCCAVCFTIWDYIHDVRIGEGWEERYAAVGFNANDLGAILSMGIPLAWRLATDKARAGRSFSVLNTIYPFVAVFGIVLSASRSSLLIALPNLLLFIASFHRFNPWKRLALCVIASLALAGLSWVDLTGPLDRLSTIRQSIMEDGMNQRLDLWLIALDTFSAHPLFGVGFGAFPSIAETRGFTKNEFFIPVVHNTYLSVITETGIIGFLLFLAVLAVVIRNIITQSPGDRLASAALFYSWFMVGNFVTYEHKSFTWLCFIIIIIFNQVSVNSVHQSATTSITLKLQSCKI
jgi:O-antigen ligase